MSGLGSDNAFELAVEPHNDQYHPDDDRWRDQLATLYTELHAIVDVATARPGTDTVVLDTGRRRTAYLGHVSCSVQVSAER